MSKLINLEQQLQVEALKRTKLEQKVEDLKHQLNSYKHKRNLIQHL